MNDRELKYILTIASEQNLTHAAEKLHMAQPSLTQCLKRIEGELGCKLFIREKYGLRLTPEGELYTEMARNVLERFQQFQTELETQKQASRGKLRIGASWYHTLLLLSEAVPDFTSICPEVEMELAEKNSRDLLDMFGQGQNDMILIHEYPRQYPASHKSMAKDVHREHLLDERFVLAAHQKYHLSAENGTDLEGVSIIDPTCLIDMPMIAFHEKQRIRNITDFALSNGGISVKRVIFTQSFPSALDLAERGMGLIVLPEHYVMRNISRYPHLQVFHLPDEWYAYWSSYILYREEDIILLKKTFMKCLHSAANQLNNYSSTPLAYLPWRG